MRHSTDTNHGHDTPGSPETPFWRAGLFYTLLTALLVWLSPMVMPWRTMFPDFICFWTAGKLLVEGASPYDRELQIRTQEEYGWDRMRDGQGVIDYLPFYYPPWFGLLFVPFVWLGFEGARTAWFFLNLEGVLLSGYLLSGAVRGIPRWVPPILSPLFLFSLAAVALGQSTTFIYFLLVLSWQLLERRWDRTAGVTLAWLTIKPQLSAVLLVGLMLWLVRHRRWRVIASFGLTLSLLACACLLIVPYWPMQLWNTILNTPAPTEFFPLIGNAWLLVLRSFGMSGASLWAAYLALVLPILSVFVWTAIRPGSQLVDLLSLGTLAAFFVAPYARHYDFPILLIPLLATAGRLNRWLGLALVALLAVVPYVQLSLLESYKQQQQSSVRFLVESTFFWVPMLLTAAFAYTIFRNKNRKQEAL